MEQAVAAGMPGDAFPPGRYGPGFSARLVALNRRHSRKGSTDNDQLAVANYQLAVGDSEGPAFRCPAFRPATNDCAAYDARPLDCRLYPFMLLYDADGKEVFLGLDTFCPAVPRLLDNPQSATGDRHFAELASLLDGALREKVIASRGIVGARKEHVRRLRALPALTRALCRTHLGLARLAPTARERLLPYFQAHHGAHSLHAFAPIYVWSDILDLHYKISGDRLLIFAEEPAAAQAAAGKDGDGFLICPPLGTGDIAGPAQEALETMRALAPRGPSPRIQDADDDTARRLAHAGWRIRETHVEYLYPRSALADLRGNRYEKKRQLCNRFERDVKDRRWRALDPNDLPEAIALYSNWLKQRTAAHPGEVLYTAQAEASWRTLYRALRDAEALQLVARALEADGRMAGFTVGCPLHDGQTFHVMFEVTDLSIKGAAQFMFRELCRELGDFDRINAGSASGLDNLARVKESYRPSEHLPAHTLVPDERTNAERPTSNFQRSSA
jgi:hypothetical protein